MGLETNIPEGVLLTRLEDVINWGRKNSLWPMPFGTACCAIEFMGAVSSEYDVSRFGAELVRFSPRQADLLLVMGTINYKMAPILQKIYNQMCEPKWVIAVGACATCGGFYDNYSVIQGIDQIIPVDVYVAGCPPRPENILEGIIKLQQKITTDKATRPAVRFPEDIHSGSTFALIPPPIPAPDAGGNTRLSSEGPDEVVKTFKKSTEGTPSTSSPSRSDDDLFSSWTT